MLLTSHEKRLVLWSNGAVLDSVDDRHNARLLEALLFAAHGSVYNIAPVFTIVAAVHQFNNLQSNNMAMVKRRSV